MAKRLNDFVLFLYRNTYMISSVRVVKEIHETR